MSWPPVEGYNQHVGWLKDLEHLGGDIWLARRNTAGPKSPGKVWRLTAMMPSNWGDPYVHAFGDVSKSTTWRGSGFKTAMWGWNAPDKHVSSYGSETWVPTEEEAEDVLRALVQMVVKRRIKS